MTEPVSEEVRYTPSGLRIIETTPEGWDIVDIEDILDRMDVGDPCLDWTTRYLSDEEFFEIIGAAERSFLNRYKHGYVRRTSE